MKLMWFSHFVPYPPRGGAPQRSFNLIRQASKSWKVSLVAFNLEGHDPARLAEYQPELRKHCETVEFWELPIRWRSPLWWARLAWSPIYPEPYGCRSLWSPGLAARWKQTLDRLRPALVHFDSIDLGMFAPAAEGFRKALNHHNCESAMAYRRAEKEPNPLKKAYLWHQARKLERLERELCPRFDVNLAVSQLDVQTLQQGSPKAHFHVVENGTDTDYFRPASENNVEPHSLIFAGSLRWYPNVSAIRFFVSEVWPRLKRQCPAVRLYLAGQKPPDSLVEWLRKYPDIIVIPTPEDIRPWVWKAAVFICPILDGGGTKLKILDALALGKAVVSTRIGCEGLQVREGVDVLLADTPENFTAQVKRALEDTELRKRLGESGRRVVEEKYSWDVVGRHLHDAYRSVLSPTADQ